MMTEKSLSRRSVSKWSGALAAAGVVGVGLGFGGDLLTRPNVKSTSTSTVTGPKTTMAGQVTTVTTTGPTTTVTAPAQTLSYVPPLWRSVQTKVNGIVSGLIAKHEGKVIAYT
ncbi:MAG: hypothetical protein JRN20_18550 [Nitrososphaerota archaeon]|nr:hypothetical protein [Nitrososphaerota archaeon]